MTQAVQTAESNVTYKADGCFDLPTTVKQTPTGRVIESVWELDGDELMAIMQTKRIRLTVHGNALPPVLVEVVNVGEVDAI